MNENELDTVNEQGGMSAIPVVGYTKNVDWEGMQSRLLARVP